MLECSYHVFREASHVSSTREDTAMTEIYSDEPITIGSQYQHIQRVWMRMR